MEMHQKALQPASIELVRHHTIRTEGDFVTLADYKAFIALAEQSGIPDTATVSRSDDDFLRRQPAHLYLHFSEPLNP